MTEARKFSRVIAPDGRTVVYPGTRAQAEAYVKLQYVHDTDPEFPVLLAQLRGQKQDGES